MFLLVSHYPDFLNTSCIHASENYVQSIVLYGLRSQDTEQKQWNCWWDPDHIHTKAPVVTWLDRSKICCSIIDSFTVTIA